MNGDTARAAPETALTPFWFRAVNFAAFQIGWFACILGAANGVAWAGPVAVGLLFALHLSLVPARGQEIRLALAAAAFGFVFDSLFSATGILVYAESLTRWICPPWLLAMWVNFAMTLRASMSWLQGRPALAALTGAVSGPLAYLAGARLGAVEFQEPLWVGTLALAIAWGVATPLLLHLASKGGR